jgi:transcriptional regulator with XRE-family HTH domain
MVTQCYGQRDMASFTLHGMSDDDRGVSIARRMDRLGISVREMAKQVGLDRQAVTRAREGRSHGATYGRIEAALDALEEETGHDGPETHVTAEVRLPGGATATVSGLPADVAHVLRSLGEDHEAAFLRSRG